MIRIVIIENQYLYREGVVSVFRDNPDIRVTGEADTIDGLFETLATTPADMVIIGANTPEIIGVVYIARIVKRDYPNVKILAVSNHFTLKSLMCMAQAGIEGYMVKKFASPVEMEKAIREIAKGEIYCGVIN